MKADRTTPEPATRMTTPAAPPHPVPPTIAGMPPVLLTNCFQPASLFEHWGAAEQSEGAARAGESVVKLPAVPPAALPEYVAADTVIAVAPDAPFLMY